MNLSTLLSLVPYVLQAVDLAQRINKSHGSGVPVGNLIDQYTPEAANVLHELAIPAVDPLAAAWLAKQK